ncbi:partial UvrABC system protein B, partial [uncultured bacterium]
KEGFLRSTGSLIQTIGRAARNLRGTAILYADNVTRSMRAAIDETERRRNRQLEYNAAHGITPRSVERRITDVMEGARDSAATERGRGRGGVMRKVAESAADYQLLNPEQLAARIRELEARMYKHAQNLEFEEAARVRDEIHRIREQGLIA